MQCMVRAEEVKERGSQTCKQEVDEMKCERTMSLPT